jgi:hypothetical protein
MWDAIFILAALASPLILLALAAGLAGPVIKIKVRLALIAVVILITTIGIIIKDIVSGKISSGENTERNPSELR